MPPLPSPGTILKVQVVWTIGEDTNCMNVLHYRYSGSRPLATDCSAIAAHLAAAPLGAYLTHIPTSTSLTNVIVTDLQGNDGQQGSAGATQVGTAVSALIPASAALLMHLKVNARYRGGHPRIYFPPMASTYLQDQQVWLPTALSSVLTPLQAFVGSLPGFSAGGCIVGAQCAVSYYNKAVNPTPPHLRPAPLVLDVVSTSLGARVGSQRRRLIVG